MIKEKIVDCRESKIDSIIVLKENKSIYRGINQNNENISKYKIDGCVYTNSTDIRCDYLLETTSKLFFIELKGVDIKKGLSQLHCSIINLKPFFKQKHINSRLISTKGVRPNRLNTYKEYKDLLKLIGVKNLIIRNTPFQENLN